MILAFNIADIVQVPFGYLLSWLYQFTTNYGVALMIFAVLVKLILFPASAKSKKSTMKMSRLTPRIQVLQEKYKNDQQKLNEETQKLYKEEGANPMGGCLWSFLPLAVLIPLYGIVRKPLTNLLGTAGPDRFLTELAAEHDPGRHGVVKLHFYTFGGLRPTAEWVRSFRGY